MKKYKFAPELICLCLIVLSFVGCNTDFVTLESDVLNSDDINNFNIQDISYDVVSYNKVLGPVQTEDMSLGTLGIYNDNFGTTASSFVSQLTLSDFNPQFGEGVIIDSVVLTIPYFIKSTQFDNENNLIFDIDSVIGRDPIILRIFENQYFIRDFDPNGDFDAKQPYFSNKSASESEPIPLSLLEGGELGFVEYNAETEQLEPIDNIIDINENGYILTEVDNEDEDEDPQFISIQPPGLRILLDPTFWEDKIIEKEGEPELASPNNFNDYFRGLYFKAEPVNGSGSHLMLNLTNTNPNITIFYSRLTEDPDDDPDTRENDSYILNFGPNRINFMDNDFSVELSDGDETNGDARLLLKGGEGSVAKIKLFNGEDIDDDDDNINSFEFWKSQYVETDDNGNFQGIKRLVNEANLVFFVDQDLVGSREPNRIYLYNTENKTPLIDYFLDIQNNGLPSASIINHLGPLQREGDESNGQGIKYKIKITEHIKNLLVRDSTNVELGLAVSLNVNLENPATNPPQRIMQQPSTENFTVPISSVLSPRGTVLHGNNSEDESKRVYLEIYYTEPNN
ncbi:DUF4270 domain-containing protein [Winogradskyella aurantia]|uniref:DUF4270 domain-containing protein n=1 Tax=Winogradskyella aurantia TaxID=1915063 RepID=A0A265UZD6_9FLAO|nr:DUF4270 domain-containing protein [Winogradskyella aurantia]OZV70673.1 hypothetical protein CA834_00740 [Winogradskyella aurantia]